MLLTIRIAFLFLLLSLTTCPFAKEDTEADLVAVANENHLLQYRENGVDKGPSVDILHAMLKAADLKATITFMPWARAFSTARNHPNTLILSMIRTAEREDSFHWLIKVSQLTRVFISLKSKPENYVDNIAQAKKKITAVVLGSAAHHELVSAGFSANKNLYIVSNGEQMINLLVNGRVDLVYDDPEHVLNVLDNSGKANIAIDYKKITIENQRASYIALNKNTDKKIVTQLQQAARKLEKTAEYMRLFAK